MKIKWDDFVLNNEVLCLARADEIEFLLDKNRLHWFGHVACMQETKAVEALLDGELAEGNKRNVGCPMPRFKDTIEDILKRGEALDSWTKSVGNLLYLNGAN